MDRARQKAEASGRRSFNSSIAEGAAIGFGATLNGSKTSGKRRPCAVFEYCGEAMEQRDAMRLIET